MEEVAKENVSGGDSFKAQGGGRITALSHFQIDRTKEIMQMGHRFNRVALSLHRTADRRSSKFWERGQQRSHQTPQLFQ